MVRFSRSRWVCVLAALFVFFGLAGSAFAQTDVTTSRISGTVEDSSKAPLPGVTVEATNTETGLQQVAVTDANGFYRILNLPTGTYKITATLDGFATATAESVRLLIGSTPTRQLHPAERAGLGDDHRHRRGADGRGDQHPDRHHHPVRADQEPADPGHRLQAARAADPGDPQRLRARQPLDLRPARHQHQRHGGRRGLQQRLLRRHHRRRRGARAAVDLPGVDQGVLGDHQRRLGRVRPLGRRLRQRHHQERHQQPARLRLLLQPAAEPDLRLRHPPDGPGVRSPAPPIRPTRRRTSSAPRWAARSSGTGCSTSSPTTTRSRTSRSRLAQTVLDQRHLRPLSGVWPPRTATRRPATATSPSGGSTTRSTTPTA